MAWWKRLRSLWALLLLLGLLLPSGKYLQAWAQPPSSSSGSVATKSTTLTIPLRKRVADESDDQPWREVHFDQELVPQETAILICDMWDKHWCKGATRRCGELAEKMAPVIELARERGIHIIHAPSSTLDFYKKYPARMAVFSLPKVDPPVPLESWCNLISEKEGELPIDDSDGGCDCLERCKEGSPWRRQNAAISIRDEDLISDHGADIYNFIHKHGIKNIIYVGVHTNMCVLGRSFGIRRMTQAGMNTMLVRDLTDTMYNPRMRPQVEHREGTRLVVEHIEKHWCPTLESCDLTEALQAN